MDSTSYIKIEEWTITLQKRVLVTKIGERMKIKKTLGEDSFVVYRETLWTSTCLGWIKKKKTKWSFKPLSHVKIGIWDLRDIEMFIEEITKIVDLK